MTGHFMTWMFLEDRDAIEYNEETALRFCEIAAGCGVKHLEPMQLGWKFTNTQNNTTPRFATATTQSVAVQL